MNINASSVWDNCLSFIKDNIQPQAFKTWFLPIKPVKLNGNVLSIEVPSKFFYEWLEEHYVKLLKTALYKELGNEARLIYSIRMENTLEIKLLLQRVFQVVIDLVYFPKMLTPTSL